MTSAVSGEGSGPASPKQTHRLVVVGIVLGLLLLVAARVALFSAESVESRLSRARRLHIAGELSAAEDLATSVPEQDPRRAEALLLAADCAADRNADERALGYLDTLQGNAATLVPVHLRRARLFRFRLHRFDDAESAYRAVLAIEPDQAEANEELARLLGMCGRRREAIPHVLRLLRAGRVSDLLVLLARNDGRINDPATLAQARLASPSDRNPALGEAAALLADDRAEEASLVLRRLVGQHPDFAPAIALAGWSFLRAGQEAELADWAARLTPEARAFPETWRALGESAERHGDRRGAIRCYGETLALNPENRAVLFRLIRLLSEESVCEEKEQEVPVLPKDASQKLVARLTQQFQAIQTLEKSQTQVLFSSDAQERHSLLDLAQHYEAVGRHWESLGWLAMAQNREPLPPKSEGLRKELLAGMSAWPLELTDPAKNPVRGSDFSRYPLPNFTRSPAPAATSPAETGPLGAVRFRDDAQAAGLDYRFTNGTVGTPTQRMFEFTGGGIAALDYDRDGYPDLFLTQGRVWPPDATGDDLSDRLYRNRAGASFTDVSAASGLAEVRFGQGIAAGDLDGDGFPDVYVANIGPNSLWHNNGDGTWSNITAQASLTGEEWTTSCVMADLSGDGLPDLFDVNYVQGLDVFERVCRETDGHPSMCMPFDFDGAPDRLWINDGAGRFEPRQANQLDVPAGKGLGALAWNPEGDGRLRLFVANDTTPNQLYVPVVADPAAPSPALLRLEDQAFEFGLALNGDGKATGCMGIAAADVNGDGRLDLEITNFLSEPSTLFVSQGDGTFLDQSRALGLGSATTGTLGFGTQFLDADLDGRFELFLANGHIDDLERLGRPYRQPAQLFRWDGRGHFVESPATDLGPYFESRWLGRACARLDWNRDGLPDLVVGHLTDPYALLTNESPGPGRGLTLVLTGRESSRDAIGTQVRVTAGPTRLTSQLTAGDGYQSSNERTLTFGLGDAKQADELTVEWPSGRRQTFHDVPVPARLLLVEGGEIYPAP